MTAHKIFAQLRREQRKLNMMQLGDPEILKRSERVDRLVMEYMKAVNRERKAS